MSIEHRRIESVIAVIQELVEQGQVTFRPGDVAASLRDANAPLPVWQIRGDFTTLESQGRISCDASTGNWVLLEQSESLQDAG